MDQIMRVATKQADRTQVPRASSKPALVLGSGARISTGVFSVEHWLRRRVTRWRFLALVASVPFVSLVARPADLILDLTKARPDNTGHLGVPGRRVGGVEHGGKAPKAIPLPLEVTVQQLWPLTASYRDKFAAEILVRNMGMEPVAIPISRNYLEVVKPGNQDQRMLTVFLKLTPTGSTAGNMKPISIAIGLTVGSSSVPNSTISLAPQESLLIRSADGSLFSDADKWHDAGPNLVTVSVKAVLREEFLEEGAFVVRSTSEDATSRNAVDLTLTLTR
jgi:hypothetical protein